MLQADGADLLHARRLQRSELGVQVVDLAIGGLERGKLPFVSPDQVPPKKRAAPTQKCSVMPSTPSGTLPLGDESIPMIIAAMPFQGADARTTIYIRDMKLETYTSLCAELRAQRRPVDTILIQYGVPSGLSLQVLHEHWTARFATHPDEQAWFAYLLPLYTHHAYHFPW